MPISNAAELYPNDACTPSSPPRFARSAQMIDCLRREWLYSEKRPRDLLFAAIEDVMKQRSGMMVSQLAREATSLARERATAAGLTVDNWDATTRAVDEVAPRRGRAQPRAMARRSRSISRPRRRRLAASHPTSSIVRRPTCSRVSIARLGDVTTSDHRALAHALFRQFDARVSVEEMEDRVVILLAQLADRISLVGDTYEHSSDRFALAVVVTA